jgi:glucosamine--fructose-6-phosphate aminotransferase (isomerizing)
MCGIVAYLGRQQAAPILLESLRHLEYRGYDSAGIATLDGSTLHVRKCAGRVDRLAQRLAEVPAPGCLGIGHTRWATHGRADDRNAHPHVGGDNLVAVVHNGVVENYTAVRRRLTDQGFIFHSETDTEAIAHLIASYFDGNLVEAVRRAVRCLEGACALAVVSPRQPDVIVGVRRGSPLVLGVRQQEHYLASDVGALEGRADRVMYLEDGQIVEIRPDGWKVAPETQEPRWIRLHARNGHATSNGLGLYPHFMLKEIHEQPASLWRLLAQALDDDAATGKLPDGLACRGNLCRTKRIIMTACGSSYHAALFGEYLFEELARIPVEVEYASEFRYRDSPVAPSTLLIALSQSGETADTLAALRSARTAGCPTLALCNVTESNLAREADGVVALKAGREIGVASTKAFANQLAALALLASRFARLRGLWSAEHGQLLESLRALPEAVRRALDSEDLVRRLAAKYAGAKNFLFLGRQYLYPIALEGALKLTEVSYVHAQGYPAAEIKHGPIALVDAHTPSVFVMPRGPVYDKVLSNLQEVKARGGPVIAIASEGDTQVSALADDVIFVPDVPKHLQAVVSVVPLQLLAYFMAIARGCDVDRPRNLAKSVTVE